MIFLLLCLALLVSPALADDTAFIQQAVNSRSIILPGIYQTGYIRMVSGTALIGSAPGQTMIRLLPGAHAAFVNLDNTFGKGEGPIDDVVIRDLTLDGNAPHTQAGLHCIRAGGNTTNVTKNVRIENVRLKNCPHYGIGLQQGIFQDITLRDLRIFQVGSDGIDIKNPAGLNQDITIENVRVRDFGSLGIGHAGVDVRGENVQLVQVTVRNVSPGNTGIRFHQSSSWSGVDQFYVQGQGSSICLHLNSQAQAVTVTHGITRGCGTGIYAMGREHLILGNHLSAHAQMIINRSTGSLIGPNLVK